MYLRLRVQPEESGTVKGEKMFKDVVVGEKITVSLGVATQITGLVMQVEEHSVTFIGDITVYEFDDWALELEDWAVKSNG